MEFKAAIVVSCWFTVAVVSSVYMWIFGSDLDIAFGVFLPIGFLILVAVIVTFMVLSSFEPEKTREAESTSDLQSIRSKLDLITKEIKQIKNENEK